MCALPADEQNNNNALTAGRRAFYIINKCDGNIHMKIKKCAEDS